MDKNNTISLNQNKKNKSNSNKKDNAQKLRNYNIKVKKNNDPKITEKKLPQKRTKNNSPLFLKIKSGGGQIINQKQKPLKKIKIDNINTEHNIAKSSNNSNNKKTNKNNNNNKKRFSPPLNTKKFDNSVIDWHKELMASKANKEKKQLSNNQKAISARNIKNNKGGKTPQNEKEITKINFNNKAKEEKDYSFIK